MVEYIDMWERINKKEWVERKQKAVEKRDYVRFICTAVHAAQSWPGQDNEPIGKQIGCAKRLLDHFGIPGCHDLTPGSILKTWVRYGTLIRPDEDLLEIFVYAQKEKLLV
jgi:hypothetical protein